MKESPPRSGPVTIADVARRARVSTAVVSRLVNNDQALSIRDETRSRVLAAIADLGYRPNATARGLRLSRSDAFGLIIPNFDNPVYAKIIEGAEAAAVDMGCVLLTGSTAGSGLLPMHYAAHLASGRVDGLLLADTEADGVPSAPLRSINVPFLLVNRRAPGIDRYVVLDDEKAADVAVSHLVSLGHVRIAHIAGPQTADTAIRRAARLSGGNADRRPAGATGARDTR